jgi:hypothetical protein
VRGITARVDVAPIDEQFLGHLVVGQYDLLLPHDAELSDGSVGLSPFTVKIDDGSAVASR